MAAVPGTCRVAAPRRRRAAREAQNLTQAARAPAPSARRRAFGPPGRRRAGVAGRLRLAPALLAGALGAPVFGQDFAPRPIYYTMLQAAESSFAERVATLESARRSDQAALGRRAARARVRFDRERVRIEREQRAWERAFEAEREALNARIARLGAAPVGVTALVAAAEAEFEGARVAVNAARSRYRALALEARARRDALESATRAYRDRDGEAAREIDRLARAFEAFHAEQSAASDARAAERRREAQEFDGWQQEELAHLRDMERRRAAAAKAYAALAREHERRLGALNRLVHAYNERGRSGAPGEAEAVAGVKRIVF